MKNLLLICFVLIIINSRLYAQSDTKCNACVFLNIDFRGEKPIFDKPCSKAIKYLKHNLKDENYVVFKILDKNDSLFYVQAEYSIDNEFIAKGWIRKDMNIGIYSRAYNIPLKLYSAPDNGSKVKYTFNEYNPEMYVVIDCIGEWLKVKIVVHGKKYIGWMSPDMQCCNVYSTCS